MNRAKKQIDLIRIINSIIRLNNTVIIIISPIEFKEKENEN